MMTHDDSWKYYSKQYHSKQYHSKRVPQQTVPWSEHWYGKQQTSKQYVLVETETHPRRLSDVGCADR